MNARSDSLAGRREFDIVFTAVALVLLFLIGAGAVFSAARGAAAPEMLTACCRMVVNPVARALPEPARRQVAERLGTPGRQAACGAWLLAAALAASALLAARPASRWARQLDFETLIRRHARRSPRVLPVLRCDPREDRSLDGPWAMAPTHRQWARMTGIDPAAELEAEQAERLTRALEAQLHLRCPADEGKQPGRAADCVEAVESVCLLRILGKREAGNAAIDALATPWGRIDMAAQRAIQMGRAPLPNLRAIRRLSKKTRALKGADALLAEIRKGHHYPSTRAMALIERARAAGGVLEPSAFLWLRPACRPLWMAVQQLGMNLANIEAAAIAAHYAAELDAGQAIPEPQLASAIWGINEALRPYREATP